MDKGREEKLGYYGMLRDGVRGLIRELSVVIGNRMIKGVMNDSFETIV